jgi:malonyl-CoA/methylmalonyl-CoA synthetase
MIIATEVTAEEALYFLNKTKATYILVDGSTFDIASKIKDYAQKQDGQNLNLIPITRAELESSPCSPALEINEELTFSPTLGCLVLFTSGTTGLPKGVVLPRQLFDFTANQQPPAILYLASCPVHWIGGTGLIDSVLTGEKLHIMKNGPTPSRFWEVLREGKVTEMSVSPTLLRELMEYYIENIGDLSTEERERYINGAKTLQRVYTSGSMLNPSTRQFFANLTNMPITNAYGITEMGGGITATPAGSIFEEVRLWL